MWFFWLWEKLKDCCVCLVFVCFFRMKFFFVIMRVDVLGVFGIFWVYFVFSLYLWDEFGVFLK